MAIVLDTSVAFAALDRDDAAHPQVAEWLAAVEDRLVTTPLVLAELDHLVSRWGGGPGRARLRADLRSGALGVEWTAALLASCLDVAEAHPHVALTDASLVALAARLRTTDIATLDERHFRGLEPLTGGPSFRLLPADR